MIYYKLVFGIVFLPLTMMVYQFTPRKKRWGVLLISGILFYTTFSLKRMLYPVLAAVISYGGGLLLEKLKSRKKIRKSRAALAVLIALLVLILLHVKYTDFFLENLRFVFGKKESGWFAPRNYLLPLGISFYTMQAIGYLVDVYWEKVRAQKNPARLLLFLMFFPTVVQGPITSYTEMEKSLYEGENICRESIISGYLRFGWGVMKKLVIADRLQPAVAFLFAQQTMAKGAAVPVAAVLFTVMEYMDFSGCMDMVCGISSIFGIRLMENFRQPFLAQNASEFWRRWHISLGVWFKTYIFYPVSMSAPARNWRKWSRKKVSPHTSNMVLSAMALLPVWLCNGFWHGPKWTYIFYGIYYFAVILAELCLEPFSDRMMKKLGLGRENKAVCLIRILKTWVIIFLGELIFEAPSLKAAFGMLQSMFTQFDLRAMAAGISLWGLDHMDWCIVGVGLAVVVCVNLYREKGVELTEKLLAAPLPLRWAAALLLVMVIMILGLYGPGYQEVDFIYAGF